jgi:putative molybdopterin biosynthesis protein
MRKVELSYDISPQRERAARIRNPLIELLHAVRTQGSISGAARQLGLSYRHVWGELKRWEQTLEQPLIVWERGQAAQLTPFADKLLWTERLAQARLAPQIETLRAELERTLSLAFDPAAHVLSLYASHDDALPLLQDHAASHAGLHLDLRFCGSVDALQALNDGRCVVAGFHARHRPDESSPSALAYRPLLQPGRHKLLGFAQRTQGLMVAPGNPLQLDSLARVARWRARFVNRAAGTGTRLLLLDLLAEQGLQLADLRGHDQCEPSHAAVAQAVASGQADAGLGTQAAAQAAGLDFVPLAIEHYWLACMKDALDQPALLALRQVLASDAWRLQLGTLAGYTPDACGEVWPLKQALPWWHYRHARPARPVPG